MVRVLVVEDSLVQARHLESFLRENGYEVAHARNGLEGLQAIREAIPDIVVTNLIMPQMTGLDLVKAVRMEFPNLPVVLTTDFGNEELAVDALRTGAASYVPKRNLERDILDILEDVTRVSYSQKQKQLFTDRMTSTEVTFELENDPDMIPGLIGHIETMMNRFEVGPDATRMRLGVAIHEAIVNAMVHGNLEVSSDLKEGEGDEYHDAIAERQKTAPYSERRVRVSVLVSRKELRLNIADEGPGFDPEALPDPTDVDERERASGRGLLLIRTFLDEVYHNARGNTITMVKRW